MPTTRRNFKHLLRSRDGGVLISFALMLPVLMIMLGVAVDYMNMTRIRSALQAASDASAIAGAKQFAVSGIKDDQIRGTTAAVAEEAVEDKDGVYGLETGIDRDKASVKVVLRQEWTPFFAHFLKSGITPVETQATAVFLGTSNICVLALDRMSLSSIHLNITARMQANNCGVYSNSGSLAGIRLDLMGEIRAQSICSAGGVLGLLSKFTPKPVTDCPPLPDPLADRSPPDVEDCDFNDTHVKAGTTTLSPGVYCGGLEVSGTTRVTLEPGLYVMKDGPLKLGGKSSFDGSDVAFYLTGSKSVLNFSGTALIKLSGMETGGLAGILFFEDRASAANRLHVISSTKVEEMTGTIYLPRGRILIDPNAAVAAESAYTAIIANRIDLTQGPVLVLNSDYGATQVPVPDGIRATSKIVLTE